MHLFVVTHGLQGNSESLEYLCDSLEKNLKYVVVLNSKVNSETAWFTTGPFKNWSLTSDGIDNGGNRLSEELVEYVKKNIKMDFNQISFIGSSLGGLYCRYVMGKLYNEDNKTINIKIEDRIVKMKIINFVSMASPLLGVSCLSSSFLEFGTKMYFFNGTGSQLVLDDDNKSPIIYKMNSLDSNEYKSLSEAKNRITICSSLHDEWKVPYQSSGIIPWKDLKFNTKEGEIISDIHEDDEGIPEEGKMKYYDKNSKNEMDKN
eukprot:gene3852-7012_t